MRGQRESTRKCTLCGKQRIFRDGSNGGTWVATDLGLRWRCFQCRQTPLPEKFSRFHRKGF